MSSRIKGLLCLFPRRALFGPSPRAEARAANVKQLIKVEPLTTCRWNGFRNGFRNGFWNEFRIRAP